VRIELTGSDLPGRAVVCRTGGGDVAYANIAVGLQDKHGDVVDRVFGDAARAAWSFDVEVSADGSDIKGRFVQGKKGDRFFYLSWGVVDDGGGFSMFRRAKLMLAAVPADVWRQGRERGVLRGSLGLTLGDGTPLCAAVRPPRIAWA
jgi:hypothetical protein